MVKSNVSSQHGFTLIELMVVIAIITILAAFTAPSFESHIAKAKLVDVQILGSQITSSVDEHILIHNQYPSTDEFKSIAPDYSNIKIIKSINVNSVDDLQGTVTIALNSNIGIKDGATLIYSRPSSGQWVCESTLSENLIPEYCSAAE